MKRWHNNGRLQWGKLEVSGGLLFWIALLWYLGYDAVLACFLPAAALHELGHILAVWQCGGSVRRLRLSLVGAELVLDGRERLSYRQELWVAAAGPLTNLVTGVLAAQLWRSDHGEGLLLFAGASLVLGCFNLLPLEALDGGQMLCAALSGLGTPKAGEKIQTAGHRLGLCGTAAVRGGEVIQFRTLSSLSLRIAHPMPGVGAGLLPRLTEQGNPLSTLILSPPGRGKTTLLRDLVRAWSVGEGVPPQRVALADERGEVAALSGGVPQLDVGQADVMDGCPKAAALLMLLRSMNPQVLAADEITAPADVEAISMAANCGVAVLATAHGSGLSDLLRRPLYREVMEQKVFRRLVTIRMEAGTRRYGVEVLA